MEAASGGEVAQEDSKAQSHPHTFQFPGLNVPKNADLVDKRNNSSSLNPMSKTMFNKRSPNMRQNLNVERDYSTYVLGQYKFGLYQKNPRSKSKDASALDRFSQLAAERFKDTNAKYMKIYEKRLVDNRKKRKFLSMQLNKSPDQK